MALSKASRIEDRAPRWPLGLIERTRDMIHQLPAAVTSAYFRRALARLSRQSTATAEAAEALATAADKILAARARRRGRGDQISKGFSEDRRGPTLTRP